MTAELARMIYDDWAEGRFPFDRANCGACLSEHQSSLCCQDAAHAELREAVRKADLVNLIGKMRKMSYSPGIENIRSKFMKLRRKYRRFWKKASHESGTD
jgi:hypothetical protein